MRHWEAASEQMSEPWWAAEWGELSEHQWALPLDERLAAGWGIIVMGTIITIRAVKFPRFLPRLNITFKPACVGAEGTLGKGGITSEKEKLFSSHWQAACTCTDLLVRSERTCRGSVRSTVL